MKEINKREKELCVLCGCETPYHKDQHIDTRYHYIEEKKIILKAIYSDNPSADRDLVSLLNCAGQLCKECCDHCDALGIDTTLKAKG